jgi:hypothetical protein
LRRRQLVPLEVVMPEIRRRRVLHRFIRDRGVVVPVAATAAGLAMIGWGWLLQGRDYLPDLLLQVGSSLVLLVPLVLLGWMLEARMRRTEDRAHDIASGLAEIRSQVDDLGEATRSLIRSERADWEDAIEKARRAPDQETIAGLLRDAATLSVVASEGVRVGVPHTDLRLRFVPGPAAEVPLVLEEAGGTQVSELTWRPGEPFQVVARSVAEMLVARDAYPGDDDYDSGRLVMALLDVIEAGVAARTGRLPHPLGPLIELPNPQWAIASDGLHCRVRKYHIPAERLLDTAEDWRGHMLAKSWVDRTSFLQAYDLTLAIV